MNFRSKLRIRTRLRSVAHAIWPPKPNPLILVYHRVADEPVDPWGIAVSPGRFEDHLQILRRSRHPLPLTDFVDGLLAGTLPRNAVTLTFDDGYVDNLVAGKPRLARADVPATVFLATGYVDRLEPFWWDELARAILLESGVKRFELVIRNETMHFDLGVDSAESDDGTTVATFSKKRQHALWTIWQRLRRLEDEERRLIMLKLRSIFADTNHRPRLARAMTGEEVRALVADEIVKIGAHSVTHPSLAGLDVAACRGEIIESKRTCEALVEAPVAAFAYPYGDFDAGAREAVLNAGFAIACSMQRGPAIATSDVLALPRLHVPNLDGDDFERLLRSASAVG
jgi:peptidoglycan/xylan/chitin deacetylase (PgdA/CDA1 family)